MPPLERSYLLSSASNHGKGIIRRSWLRSFTWHFNVSPGICAREKCFCDVHALKRLSLRRCCNFEQKNDHWRYFPSIIVDEYGVPAQDTKPGVEEITCDIRNVGDEVSKMASQMLATG
jgi:hypothetical protein